MTCCCANCAVRGESWARCSDPGTRIWLRNPKTGTCCDWEPKNLWVELFCHPKKIDEEYNYYKGKHLK